MSIRENQQNPIKEIGEEKKMAEKNIEKVKSETFAGNVSKRQIVKSASDDVAAAQINDALSPKLSQIPLLPNQIWKRTWNQQKRY